MHHSFFGEQDGDFSLKIKSIRAIKMNDSSQQEAQSGKPAMDSHWENWSPTPKGQVS
jgi:hypothetical protein